MNTVSFSLPHSPISTIARLRRLHGEKGLPPDHSSRSPNLDGPKQERPNQEQPNVPHHFHDVEHFSLERAGDESEYAVQSEYLARSR